MMRKLASGRPLTSDSVNRKLSSRSANSWRGSARCKRVLRRRWGQPPESGFRMTRSPPWIARGIQIGRCSAPKFNHNPEFVKHECTRKFPIRAKVESVSIPSADWFQRRRSGEIGIRSRLKIVKPRVSDVHESTLQPASFLGLKQT